MEGNRLIIDLDGFSDINGLAVAERLSGHVWGFKFGSVVYDAAFSPYLYYPYGKVFYDVNLYADPGQMETIVKRLTGSHVDMLTIHGMANWKPKDPELCQYLAGVTILPSASREEVGNLYGYQLNPLIRRLAVSIEENGYKYLVCSGRDLKELTSPPLPRGLVKICCGVCPASAGLKDSISPEDAIDFGADLLVLEPVTVTGPVPLLEMVDKINEDIS